MRIVFGSLTMKLLLAILAAAPLIAEEPPLRLWDDAQRVPTAADLSKLQGVEFHVLKKQQPEHGWLPLDARGWARLAQRQALRVLRFQQGQ